SVPCSNRKMLPCTPPLRLSLRRPPWRIASTNRAPLCAGAVYRQLRSKCPNQNSFGRNGNDGTRYRRFFRSPGIPTSLRPPSTTYKIARLSKELTPLPSLEGRVLHRICLFRP